MRAFLAVLALGACAAAEPTTEEPAAVDESLFGSYRRHLEAYLPAAAIADLMVTDMTIGMGGMTMMGMGGMGMGMGMPMMSEEHFEKMREHLNRRKLSPRKSWGGYEAPVLEAALGVFGTLAFAGVVTLLMLGMIWTEEKFFPITETQEEVMQGGEEEDCAAEMQEIKTEDRVAIAA